MEEDRIITKEQNGKQFKLNLIEVNKERYVILLKRVPDEFLSEVLNAVKNEKFIFLRIEPADISRLEAQHITLNKDEFNSYFYCDTISQAPIELLERYGIEGILVGAKSNPNSRNMSIDTYKEIYRRLKYLISDIPKNSSEQEKFKRIYERLANLIDYDNLAVVKGHHYAKDNQETCRNLENAVLKYKAVCTGYAETLRQTLSLVGIESIIAYSLEDEKEHSHAYNIVKLDGEWYNADLTWDYVRLRQDLKPRYCLKSDSDFLKCHKKDKIFHVPDDIDVPKCDKSLEIFPEYREREIFIKRAIKKLIKRIRGIKHTKKLGQSLNLPKPNEKTKEDFKESIKAQVCNQSLQNNSAKIVCREDIEK